MTSARPRPRQLVTRTLLPVMTALAIFATLGTLPAILSALHLSVGAAPTISDGIHLLQTPPALGRVRLPPVARPVRPGLPIATLPKVSETQEAAAVGKQDNWLRRMLHESFRLSQPQVVRSPGELPTLVLTSGRPIPGVPASSIPVPRSPVRYTAADLIRYKALVQLPSGGALLQDNVFVSARAQLVLSSSAEQAIYMDSTPRGSASIVGWGGSMSFTGSIRRPLTIKGWREATMTPAADTGNGRPYIREVAGKMTLTHVRVSSLGFWSGRTGGIAWTGLTSRASTGGATASTFTDNTYGAFVSRGRGMKFTGDLFESNQLDGFHLHRGTVGTRATSSSAVRNGANGFHVDRATRRTVLRRDVSQHNGTNGFLLDGRPLVISASASGDGVAPGSGIEVEGSAALDNGRTGILIEGGTGTLLDTNEICAQQSGIALRFGASKTILDGNDIRCSPRVGISLGPSAPGTLLSGNAISGARIGMLVSSSGSVEMDHSRITHGTVFGITIRGASSVVSGQDNVISGTGFRAVDVRADAGHPALSGSNTAEWLYHKKVTVLSYLKFHPLAILWLSIVFLVIFGALWSRRRRLTPHPYPQSVRRVVPAPEPERLAPVLVGAAARQSRDADPQSGYFHSDGEMPGSRRAGNIWADRAPPPDRAPRNGHRLDAPAPHHGTTAGVPRPGSTRPYSQGPGSARWSADPLSNGDLPRARPGARPRARPLDGSAEHSDSEQHRGAAAGDRPEPAEPSGPDRRADYHR